MNEGMILEGVISAFLELFLIGLEILLFISSRPSHNSTVTDHPTAPERAVALPRDSTS